MLSIIRSKFNFVKTKLSIVNKKTFKAPIQRANDNIINNTNETSGNLKFFVKTGLFTLTFTGISLNIGAIMSYEIYNKNKSDLLNYKVSKILEFRSKIHKWWNSLSIHERYGISIIALNTIVFMLWRIPRFFPIMSKYFVANPYSKAIYSSMLLSTFSHSSFWHYGLNMCLLYNFINLTNGKSHPHGFLTFYLSSGVFSSFFSCNIHRLLRRPGRGLGVSGALLAFFSLFCLSYPKFKVSIRGIVNFDSITAITALRSLVVFDIIGLILGWRVLVHATHLGGYAFAFLYYYSLERLLIPLTNITIREWIKIRSKLFKDCY